MYSNLAFMNLYRKKVGVSEFQYGGFCGAHRTILEKLDHIISSSSHKKNPFSNSGETNKQKPTKNTVRYFIWAFMKLYSSKRW